MSLVKFRKTCIKGIRDLGDVYLSRNHISAVCVEDRTPVIICDGSKYHVHGVIDDIVREISDEPVVLPITKQRRKKMTDENTNRYA